MNNYMENSGNKIKGEKAPEKTYEQQIAESPKALYEVYKAGLLREEDIENVKKNDPDQFAAFEKLVAQEQEEEGDEVLIKESSIPKASSNTTSMFGKAKSALLGVTMLAGVTGAFSKEAPKADNFGAETNINYVEQDTLANKLSIAQQELAETQAEFKTEHAKLMQKLAYDAAATAALNEMADYPQEIQKYMPIFLASVDLDSLDLSDPAVVNTIGDKAVKFVTSYKNPNTGPEQKAVDKIVEGTPVGGLVYEKSYSGNTDQADAGVSKEMTGRAYWQGQDNIIDRLIKKDVALRVAEKLMAQKDASQLTNTDQLASR